MRRRILRLLPAGARRPQARTIPAGNGLPPVSITLELPIAPFTMRARLATEAPPCQRGPLAVDLGPDDKPAQPIVLQARAAMYARKNTQLC